ncbi:MAG: proteasome subunit beta, partial [Candidatus Methylomirabilis sp.]|nr:proteasome subunit beta [Deltaproteobacteria bacterium]
MEIKWGPTGAFQLPSFSELLRERHPELHPQRKLEPVWEAAAKGGDLSVPHGTTILSFLYADGVVIGGDRMATEG